VPVLSQISKFYHLPTVLQTERRGRVVSTPASYSGDPGFKYRPRRPATLTEVFRCFPQSLQANVGIVPEI
jgi:hypothetical protein